MLHTLDWKVDFCDSASESPNELYAATVDYKYQIWLNDEKVC